MASSASGQDEPNRTLWLATPAGRMEPSCPLGTTRCIPQANFHQKPYNKSCIDQVCSIKMAGYWPRSFFACLWTETKSRSINSQKKNLANIQTSWPHTWSIRHTCTPAAYILGIWRLQNSVYKTTSVLAFRNLFLVERFLYVWTDRLYLKLPFSVNLTAALFGMVWNHFLRLCHRPHTTMPSPV